MRPELAELSPFFVAAEYLGVSAADLIEHSGEGILKASEPKTEIGVGGGRVSNVWAGVTFDYAQQLNYRGVREYFTPFSASVLREIERKHPLIAAIVNTRCEQVKAFCEPSQHADLPGFRVALVDKDRKPSVEEKKEMAELTAWFAETGRRDFEGEEEREERLPDFAEMAVRELLTIDRLPIELRRDRAGRVMDFRLLDGAQVKRVVETGYRGHKADIDPAIVTIRETPAQEREYRLRLDLVPEPEKIAFVQIILEKIVAAWDRRNMVFVTRQKRADGRVRGEGYSPIEQAIGAVTAFLFSMQYNASQFRTGALPKVALAFKNGSANRAQMMALQDEWRANFQGAAGAWNMPILNGDVSVLDIYKSARDMEMMKYMEFMGSIICSVFSIDSAELGLRFGQNQNVLSEAAGARAQFSKSRGLNDLLTTLGSGMNSILRLMGHGAKYRFIWTGLEAEEAKARMDARGQEVKTYKTIDEIRAELDLPPLPKDQGKVILDSTFFQFSMQAAQAGGGAEGEMSVPPDEGGEDESFDDIFDEVFKAKMDRRGIRTLIK